MCDLFDSQFLKREVFTFIQAESNDTKIAMDYALQHNDAMQNADQNIGQMLYTGANALDQMRNQRMSLKVWGDSFPDIFLLIIYLTICLRIFNIICDVP